MKKIVGVVMRVDKTLDNNPVLTVGEHYRKMISDNNMITLPISPTYNIIYNYNKEKLSKKDKEYLRYLIDMCDAIILPGGEKIFEYDKYIYSYAVKKGIPVLGICLGMQIMNYVDTNNLPVLNYNDNHMKIGDNYVHNVTLSKSSLIYKAIKKEVIKVNSRHNYNIGSITNNYEVMGYSEDNIPEYIEYLNNIGVQWHPEMMYDNDKDQKKFIKTFFEQIK